MQSPLRILHLEDDAKDAELLQAMLEAEGIVSHVTRVDSQADFLASLEQGGFDLILADHTLPSFDGLSALRIALEKCPNVPFIFVSGTLGEEVAVEALKIGATDYVLKERLSRIVPSVQRALREAQERTERKRVEQALHHAQAELAHVTRVMTMGELASSIAHEINQPLAGIITNGNAALRWLARDLPNLEEARACLQRIVRDGQRAGDVIARIRTFVHKAAPQAARLAIHDVIAEVLALADGELRRHGVALHIDLAADLPPVLADRIQLQQVLLNLLLNGMEAMCGVTERPRALIVRAQPEEDAAIRVAVEDAGVGIAPQDLERMFTAFFTTKPEGMGMGLAISRSIVQAHGGKLWATPNVGPGVTVHFTLPTGEAGAS